MIKFYLYGTIVIHYIVFISFLLTCISGYLVMPWYIATTLIALIVRVIVSPNVCPLTSAENYFRRKLGLKSSHGFLKDYILQPHKTFKYLHSGDKHCKMCGGQHGNNSLCQMNNL